MDLPEVYSLFLRFFLFITFFPIPLDSVGLPTLHTCISVFLRCLIRWHAALPFYYCCTSILLLLPIGSSSHVHADFSFTSIFNCPFLSVQVHFRTHSHIGSICGLVGLLSNLLMGFFILRGLGFKPQPFLPVLHFINSPPYGKVHCE